MNKSFQELLSEGSGDWISRRTPSGFGEIDLALWEWRVVAAREGDSGTVHTDEDGGLRFEGSLADGTPSWRFRVGDDPGGLGRWARGRAVELLEQASGRGPVARACVRARVLDAGGALRTLLDEGLIVEDPGSRSRQALHPTELGSWLSLPPGTDRGEDRRRLAWSGTETLVVFESAAAGRWAHEMLHAAMEDRFAVRATHGVRIVDDPGAAAWPAGFVVDDRGDEASAWVAWDERGSHAPPAGGHHRRPSIRVAASPAASYTRVEVTREASRVVLADLPNGTPVISSIGGGRFDPPTGTVLLSATTSGQLFEGELIRDERETVLELQPERCWKGLAAVSTAREPPPSLATCLRQGLMHAVMVGAPTIVLDGARLYLRDRQAAAVLTR